MGYYSLFVKFRSSRFFRHCKLLKNRKKWLRFIRLHYSFLTDDELEKIYGKLRIAWLKYQIGPGDFYRLHCEDKSFEQINQLLSYMESSSFCLGANSSQARSILGNKYNSYVYFKKYYGRRALLISYAEVENGKGVEKLTDFFQQANHVIVKPLDLDSGQGIKVFSSEQSVLSYIKTMQRDVVVEDVIVQDESLAAFNNSSVNTLRIHTVNYGNGEIDVLWPCLRMGRAGSVVDNAGFGGVFAAIDVKTGTTVAACDELRNVWDVHPDTKKDLIGFTVPKWQEAISFAKELARTLPDAGFVGWDLALTKHGWVIVEGNGAPLIIYQIAMKSGLKTEFRELKKRFYSKK